MSYKNSLPILLADFIKLFSSIADFGTSPQENFINDFISLTAFSIPIRTALEIIL